VEPRERALNQLEWIAYVAQQCGWDDMANRIARDAKAMIASAQELSAARRQLQSKIAKAAFTEQEPNDQLAGFWTCNFTDDDDSTEKNEENDDSSFDRLRHLEKTWREIARSTALLRDSRRLDEVWRDITGSDSPVKPS
jgi:hypothetical protein